MEKVVANLEQAGVDQWGLLGQVGLEEAAVVQAGWVVDLKADWRTSRGIVVIILVRLVGITIHIIVWIIRGWHNNTFHHSRIL